MNIVRVALLQKILNQDSGSAIRTSIPERIATFEAKVARKSFRQEQNSNNDERKEKLVLGDDDDLSKFLYSSEDFEKFKEEEDDGNPKPETESWVVVEFDGRDQLLYISDKFFKTW